MGHDSSNIAGDEANIPFSLGLLGGSLLVGTGVVLLWYSFGIEGGNMADNLSKIGASGLDDLQTHSASQFSIGLILAGALVMVVLNAGAWRRTGGY